MKTYKIKEIFFSIQGEGFHTGRPAIFCRFSGCNLKCPFCDTNFYGTDGELGGEYILQELISTIKSLWPKRHGKFISNPFVVLTGGEPALQIDEPLIHNLHKEGFYIAVETNGTLELPENIDWICVSPKNQRNLKILKGNELKLVYPQEGIFIEYFEHMEFDYFFLQPMDNERIKENTKKCIEICLNNPKWRLSLQIHKILGIP